jgi:hypothetical protein
MEDAIAMDNENVKLGRINRAVEKALEQDFGDDVWIYMAAKDVDAMAAKWPSVYLSRLSEAARIIKHPDYASYAPKKKTLYLIKEYFKEGEFSKVALEITNEAGWYLKIIYALNPLKIKEIDEEAPIKRVEM